MFLPPRELQKIQVARKKWLKQGLGSSSVSAGSNAPKKAQKTQEKSDGAPVGYAYQAESPDEGAIVSATSKEYGFQLVGRNSSGVQLSCLCPSLLKDERTVKGLKNGTVTAKTLAAQTASPSAGSSKYSHTLVMTVDEDAAPRFETWQILATNKFDSNRKRMSVLVRSPLELGSIPMLLCKGADSSMLTEEVCEGARMLESVVNENEAPNVITGSQADNSEPDSLLGLQTHLR